MFPGTKRKIEKPHSLRNNNNENIKKKYAIKGSATAILNVLA